MALEESLAGVGDEYSESIEQMKQTISDMNASNEFL
jgi:hypothetical protein